MSNQHKENYLYKSCPRRESSSRVALLVKHPAMGCLLMPFGGYLSVGPGAAVLGPLFGKEEQNKSLFYILLRAWCEVALFLSMELAN